MKSKIQQPVAPRRATRKQDHGKVAAKKGPKRLPQAERRALVLASAAAYFSEHGLNAQTRAIAQACGISQRLLYSLFPNKAALVEAVYEREVSGIFKAIWLVELKDRSVPLQERLVAFYADYYETMLTRRWLRLFLYSSLANLRIAPTYTNAIVAHTLEIIVMEAAHDAGKGVPADPHETAEIGWILHGAISHLAIRRQIYATENPTPVKKVIETTVKAFLASIPALLPALPETFDPTAAPIAPVKQKKIDEKRARQTRA